MTTAVTASAQNFPGLVRHLANFGYAGGSFPNGSLVQGFDGNFYGTTGTLFGGSGTVFRITPQGAINLVYSFCVLANCEDGYQPVSGLVLGANGNFYGTTSSGGGYDAGTVFKITPSGALTTLHTFDGTDGCMPYSPPIQAPNGDLYGTTWQCGTNGYGTVYRMTPAGALTTLHNFGGSDGAYPIGPLVLTADGDFYGTTCGGGPNNSGTIFGISKKGLTTFYIFDGYDGACPLTMIQATNGTFYGVTGEGGTYNDGTVYEFRQAGGLKTLHSFDGTDGFYPTGLVQATDGNFYGTTNAAGANNFCYNESFVGCGTAFKMAPRGTLTTLYNFCSRANCADGDQPSGGLLQATNGTFYGTTQFGGVDNDYFGCCGTAFSLSVGLAPFVTTVPIGGKVGVVVKILGTDLSGATSVTFNGIAAAFTVESPTLISAAVPAGATSGNVEVAVSNLTLSSNVPFRVVP